MIPLIAHLQLPPELDLPTNSFQSVFCGSHCLVSYEQLTPIKEIVDGWKKAKIKYTISSWYPPLSEMNKTGHIHPLNTTFGTTWLYADCKKGVFTSRSKEYLSAPPQLDGDRSALRIHSVFEKSYKFASMVKGMRFQSWAAMCPVMGQSD